MITLKIFPLEVQEIMPLWSLEECEAWLEANKDAILYEAQQGAYTCIQDLLLREEPE